MEKPSNEQLTRMYEQMGWSNIDSIIADIKAGHWEEKLKSFESPIDRFFNANNGKYLDYDGRYGAQCVDLIREYLKQVLGIDGYTLPPVDGAKEFYTKFNTHDLFEIFPNDPFAIPKKGDIMVWKWYWFITGWRGHVSLFHEGGLMNFISFDQNYKKGTPCHFQKHSYRGVLGWLRYRKN